MYTHEDIHSHTWQIDKITEKEHQKSQLSLARKKFHLEELLIQKGNNRHKKKLSVCLFRAKIFLRQNIYHGANKFS
jgi:hypothetical protein